MTNTQTVRARLAAHYNRCPVCTHRPKRLTLHRSSGAVEYRHNGLRIVSADEICSGCVNEFIELASEDCTSSSMILRVDWTARVLALFD